MKFTLEQTDFRKICQNPEIPLWYIYSDTNERTVHGRLDRFQKQFEYLKNNSGDNEKCERLLKTVDREMIVMRQFADSIFKMHAGEKYDLGFVGSSYKTQEEMEKALTGEGNRMF